MKRRLIVMTGAGLAAALIVSTLLHAQQPAQHLTAVGEHKTVLGYNVVLDGDDACMGTMNGIEIVRIANPARIEKLASIDALRDSECFVVGRYAYAGSVDNGLVVIDVSNKTAPRIVGRHRGMSGYTHLQVSGRYVYAVAFAGGLDVIDVSDPTRPALAGFVSFPGRGGTVRLSGQTAYVHSPESVGVRIVDVSDAATPKVVGNVAVEGRGGLIGIVNGHLAIATDRGVCLYDISAPRAPVMRKLLPGLGSNVCASDDNRTLFAFSRGGTTVLDLSNIDSPRVLGTIGALFHGCAARRGDLVIGAVVPAGLKVYRLGADARDERRPSSK